MKSRGRGAEGNWSWCVLVVGVLAGGCGAGIKPGDDRAVDEASAGGSASGSLPGSGVPHLSPPAIGWSLRDETPRGCLNAASVIDTRRDRLMIIGGGSPEVWSMPLSGEQERVWLRVDTTGEAPLTAQAAAVYDASADRIVVAFVPGADLSGIGKSVELWELSLGTASVLRSLGTESRLSVGDGGLRVFADGERLFAQGGEPGKEAFWRLSLEGGATWERIAKTGPIAYGERLVLDEPRNRVVAFGQPVPRALSLDTQAWSALPEDPCNSRLYFSTLLVDAAAETVISLGGECSSTWVYSLSKDAWRQSEARADEAFYGAATIDSPRQRLLALFSNSFTPGGNAIWQAALDEPRLARFTPDTRGSGPAAGDVTVWDPERKALIAFGARTLSHELTPSATWKDLRLEAGRGGEAGGIYDPDAHAVVTFGGNTTSLGVTRLASESGARWQPLDVTGPDIRAGFVGVYDSVAKRFVIHGGVRDPLYTDRATVLTDTWALSLVDEPQWIELQTTGESPGKRVGEVGAYDPEGQRLIVYGGRDYAASWDDPTYDDLHALSLGEGAATWSRLEASGQHPRLKSPRVVYDPQGRRLVFVELPNVFSLELGEQLSWHAFCQVGAPPALAVGDETSLALVPDGLFFAVGNASYRFDLTTPYCD